MTKKQTNGEAKAVTRAKSAPKEDAPGTNGSKRKPTSEMTLEELSLRAYKMTYERLHGKKKPVKREAA